MSREIVKVPDEENKELYNAAKKISDEINNFIQETLNNACKKMEKDKKPYEQVASTIISVNINTVLTLFHSILLNLEANEIDKKTFVIDFAADFNKILAEQKITASLVMMV